MNCFLFQSEICLKSMLKYVKLNIVVVITLCVGMIVPLVALADIQYFVQYGETARPAVMDSAATFYSNSPRLETAEIYGTLTVDPRFRRVAVSEIVYQNVEFVGETYYQGVYYISSEELAFYPPCMVEGRSLETTDFESGDKVCMVEENFYQDKGISGAPGDKLAIGGEQYTVVGIFRKLDSRGAIWLPWNPASLIRRNNGQIVLNIEYQIGLDFEEVRETVSPLFEDIISADTLRQNYLKIRRQGIQLSISILLLILPLLLFSMINCFAVIQGKIRRMRYQFAVEIAYGAKGKDIFQSCFLENLVLCSIALLLDVLLLPLITPHVPPQIEMVWSPRVFLEMFLLMFVICLLLSRLSARSIRKISPAKILKGE